MSIFTKCEGGFCPIKDECKRFIDPIENPPQWQQWFMVIPYDNATKSCDFQIKLEQNG